MSRTYRLDGLVLDEHGAPVAVADVRLEPGGRRTTTDLDGRFAFDGLTTRRFSLTARKDDRCAGPLAVGRDDAHTPVILRLALGTTLVVHASAGHAPVVGAVLTIDDVFSATSDATGTVTIGGLTPRDHTGWLVARGYACELIWMRAKHDPSATDERFIGLQPGSRIEGVLHDRNDKPIRDATVSLWGIDEPSRHYVVGTDAAGSWRVDARAGTYKVFAWSDAHGRSAESIIECDGHAPLRDVVLRNSNSRVTIATFRLARAIQPWLARCARISGVVVDPRGQPVAGASVSVAETERDNPTTIRWRGDTDARGRFEADVLGRLAYDVFAMWPREKYDIVRRPPRHRIRIGDSNVRIVLPTGATVTGRVLLAGAPLPSFGVVLGAPKSFGGSPIPVRSLDGRFELAHVEPGRWQVVVLGPGTRRKVAGEITTVRGQEVDLGDIAMERGQWIAGHVRDRDGSPVEGARVIVGRWGRIRMAEGSQLDQSFQGHFETLTDASGAYAFEGIDAHQGPFNKPNIWAEHHDGGGSVIHELAPGDAAIDFILLGTGKIEGVIPGLRGGRPLALAIRTDEPHAARMASVAKNERFVFAGLPSGLYVVRAGDVEDISSAEVSVVEAETASVTLMMKTSSVELVVIVPRGRGKDLVIEPISEGARVGGRSRGISVRGTEEHCHLSFVRPGDYRLSLDKITWTPLRLAASPAEQTIDLRQLSRTSG